MSGGIRFDNTSISTSTWNHVSVSGTCEQFVTSLDIQNYDGATLDNNTALSNNCKTNGTFSFKLSKNTNGLASGAATHVVVRSSSLTNEVTTTTLTITYFPPQQNKQELLVGSAKQSGTDGVTTYNLKGRVRFQNQNTATGGIYKITGRVVQ